MDDAISSRKTQAQAQAQAQADAVFIRSCPGPLCIVVYTMLSIRLLMPLALQFCSGLMDKQGASPYFVVNHKALRIFSMNLSTVLNSFRNRWRRSQSRVTPRIVITTAGTWAQLLFGFLCHSGNSNHTSGNPLKSYPFGGTLSLTYIYLYYELTCPQLVATSMLHYQ